METQSTIHYDARKNRIYLKMVGFHDVEEAKRLLNLYREAASQCRKGYTVLADVSEYKPGTDEVQKIHAEAAHIDAKAGVKKVARVVGHAPLGGMQIARISKKEGGYESAHFETFQEAEAYLDEEQEDIRNV